MPSIWMGLKFCHLVKVRGFFILSSANAFNLVLSKPSSFGKQLHGMELVEFFFERLFDKELTLCQIKVFFGTDQIQSICR